MHVIFEQLRLSAVIQQTIQNLISNLFK